MRVTKSQTRLNDLAQHSAQATGDFSAGSEVKNLSASAGDLGSTPGSGKFPGEGNGNPLLYSCLENPMDREDWRAAVHESQRVRHDLVTKQQQAIETPQHSSFST